ncbi:MAG: lycopene cyclase family protein [Spirochaetota bacterium]
MEAYDFIMAGGGMAGLSLAHALVTGPYPDASILIVDPETKGENDRTWCYWSREIEPFDSIVVHSWPRLRFATDAWTNDFDLGEYRYNMIRGADFYDTVLDVLERRPGVEFERARVLDIVDIGDAARVETDTRTVRGRWVFDSRFEPEEYERRSDARAGSHHYLKQHFVGWTIETTRPLFDPDTATLFDFRTPQHNEMRFVYVLPFSQHRALVEYTLFSANLLESEEYTRAIEAYLRDVLGVEEYRVVEREQGVIPMTDEPVRRREGEATLAIGTRGGLVKASTGYAFRRTQHDTSAIVASLARHGHPFDLPRTPLRFRALDTTLLQVMYRRGELSEPAFASMFGKNPIQRMLRFLDEKTSLAETIAIMTTVPIAPFLVAFARTQLLGKV